MSSALVGRLDKHKDGGQHGSPAHPNTNKYDEIEYLELVKERIRLNPLRSISLKSSTTNVNEQFILFHQKASSTAIEKCSCLIYKDNVSRFNLSKVFLMAINTAWWCKFCLLVIL